MSDTTFRCPGCDDEAVQLPDGTIQCADGYLLLPEQAKQVAAAREMARQFSRREISLSDLEREARS